MRDFSNNHRWLSLNTATVRKQGDLVSIIEACARHGIRAIDPWRDQVAAVGLDRAVKAVRDAGLELSGYCRGGMFVADAAHRIEERDDNRRAIDEASRLEGVELNPLIELDGLRTIASLTFDGYGPSILPATMLSRFGFVK